MKPKVIASRCPRNHKCPLLRICPVDAIKQNGYDAPTIDMAKCIGCGRCTKMCAFGAVANSA